MKEKRKHPEAFQIMSSLRKVSKLLREKLTEGPTEGPTEAVREKLLLVVIRGTIKERTKSPAFRIAFKNRFECAWACLVISLSSILASWCFLYTAYCFPSLCLFLFYGRLFACCRSKGLKALLQMLRSLCSSISRI